MQSSLAIGLGDAVPGWWPEQELCYFEKPVETVGGRLKMTAACRQSA
jgi:hypothetical protein